MTGSVALTLATRAVMTAFGLVSSILTARFLGVSGRGDYFFAVTVSATVVQFSGLGLHASNTYLAARRDAPVDRLAINSLWISLVVGGFAGAGAAFVFTVGGLFPGTPASIFWCAAALTPPTLFFLLGTNLLIGDNRVTAFNLTELLSRVVVIVLLLAAGLLSWHASEFVIASALGWTVSSVVVFVVLVRRPNPSWRFDRAVFLTGFRYAVKSYAIAVLGFLVLRSNVFVLRHYHAADQLGYLSIATQVTDVIALLPTSVALVLFPSLVRDIGRSWTTTIRSAAIVGSLLVVACVVTGLAARPFIRLAFGPSFTAAVPALRWMLPGAVAIGITTILSQYLAAHGLPRLLVGIWIGAAALAATLSLLLVPSHRTVGAAQSLSGTYIVLLVAILAAALSTRRRLDLQPSGAREAVR